MTTEIVTDSPKLVQVEKVKRFIVRQVRPAYKILSEELAVKHYSDTNSEIGKRRKLLSIFHEERFTTLNILNEEGDHEFVHLSGIDITPPVSPHAETVSLMFHQTPVKERADVIEDLSKFSHAQLQTICTSASKGVKYMFDTNMCSFITFGKTAWDFQSVNLAHWHLRGLSQSEEENAEIINLADLNDEQIFKMFSKNDLGIEACYEFADLVNKSTLANYLYHPKVYSSGVIEFQLSKNLAETLKSDAANIWPIIESTKKIAWENIVQTDSNKKGYNPDYQLKHLAAASVFYQHIDDNLGKLAILFALHMPDGKNAKGGPVEAIHQTLTRCQNQLSQSQIKYEKEFILRNRKVVEAICGGTLIDDPQNERLQKLGLI